MTLYEAQKIADEFKAMLEPFASRIEIAGSIRRKKPDDIKDVELVMIPHPKKMTELKNFLWKIPTIKGKFPGKYIQLRYKTCIIDLFITSKECWGCIFLIRTGSQEFSKRLVTEVKSKGYKFSGGRLWRVESIYHNACKSPTMDVILYTPEEADVFRELGMEYIEPENRH